jgi:L-lysine 6-transaminase
MTQEASLTQHDATATQRSAYPGPLSARLLEELGRYVISEPRPFALDLERCAGMELVTVDGQRLFDWAGYYGSKLIAHNHPALYAPDYAARLVRAANNKLANPDFLTPECLDYYRLLYRLAPRCMRSKSLEVYVVNSGAEAIENMMKYFVNIHHAKLRREGRLPGTRRFVYFEQAFHGRTVFALNITQMRHDPVATKDFQGFFPGNLHAPFPAYDAALSAEQNEARVARCLEALSMLLDQYADEIVGIIVEPIQSAGGQRVALPSFFQGLSALAHQHDVPLGFDEVQTAGGPCGDVFVVDMLDLPHPPQAVVSGKKFGNGVLYMRESMQDVGVLDSTWGGSLADMVRFVQEWGVVEAEGLLERVPALSAQLVATLHRLAQRWPALIHNVRGLGLYQGFSMRRPEDKGRLLDAALQRESLLLLGAGHDSVRLRPHMHVTPDDIAELERRLDRALAAL